MFAHLDEQTPADLPRVERSFWRLIGPSAVLVGLSIGAGEIVIWPRIVAEYGASMIWAAVLGVTLQLFVNVEIGRWTIATGETVLTGYCRVWRGFGTLIVLLAVLANIAPGWARASGLALKALLVSPTGPGSDTAWTVATFAAVALILFGPKVIYRSVELSIEVLVAIVTLGLIAVAFAVGTLDVWREMAAGVVNVGYVAPGMDVRTLFGALVFAGAGGVSNLFYTFYLRDKNIGMGARMPPLHNPLRGRSETAPAAGFLPGDDEENLRRFSDWMRYVRLDQTLFFWLLNTFTMMLFILGALAVLYPRGIVPAEGTLIWDEAMVLAEVWGQPGRVVFLVVGVATLFGTQLVIVDGIARTIGDVAYTNFAAARRRDPSWWYAVIAGAWIVAGCAITWVMEARGITELGFIMNAAYVGGFAMALYVPLTLYMNHRLLPTAMRPGLLASGGMVVASLIYVGFALTSVIGQLIG